LAISYQKKETEDQRNHVHEALEACVQEGARRMLAAALEEEVSAFLGRHRYERGKAFRGYRNGYHLSRELTVGLGPVEVQVPRVARVPLDIAPQGFQSQIVRRYQRASQVTQRLFCRLYLEGLATGDFEPVFRELVGETTALSANAVVRLKERWGKEYEVWRSRFLGNRRYAYIWADGIYLGAGMEKEKTALLCVLGAREDGEKELLAMEPGYRESTESWGGCCETFVTVGWKHRYSQWAMVPWGCGQPWTRSILLPNISDAGTTALPTCRPSCRNACGLRSAVGCGI
jgi:transposase-like protein